MSENPTSLGAFEIGECIGEGGMGKVFRAVHTTTGVPVALKVIAGRSDAASRRDFHREVQAQAGLVHPGVVYLFDYGTVDEKAAQASRGELEAGSPYVAMELADRQTVRDHMPFESWRSVRDTLLEVLDALAFAHARQVIHRDLKPENLLIFADDDGRARIKLADFGLAHAFDQDSDQSEKSLQQVSGTPNYMTPEQFRGAWRRYGPWTDLYSLGCVAWHLVCGRPPYEGETLFTLALKHCDGEMPPLQPQFPVPDGFERWLHRAMALDPRDRFQRAADAAQALVTADGAQGWISANPQKTRTREAWAETLPMQTLKWTGTRQKWDVNPEGQTVSIKDKSSAVAEASPAKVEVNSGQLDKSSSNSGGDRIDGDSKLSQGSQGMGSLLPDHWHVERKENLPTQLVGTGLGLFGHREVPFVDRDEARDCIWEALRSVVECGELRVVFITGNAGVGKSRLVRWMATRAHEVGAATVLKTVQTRGLRARRRVLPGSFSACFAPGSSHASSCTRSSWSDSRPTTGQIHFATSTPVRSQSSYTPSRTTIVRWRGRATNFPVCVKNMP